MREKITDARLAPYRVPGCAHYESCLSRAARIDGELCCTGCRCCRPQEYRLTIRDLVGCVRLVAEVMKTDPVLIISAFGVGERSQADKRGGRWVQQDKVAAA